MSMSCGLGRENWRDNGEVITSKEPRQTYKIADIIIDFVGDAIQIRLRFCRAARKAQGLTGSSFSHFGVIDFVGISATRCSAPLSFPSRSPRQSPAVKGADDATTL